jgi:hypothetical protein
MLLFRLSYSNVPSTFPPSLLTRESREALEKVGKVDERKANVLRSLRADSSSTCSTLWRVGRHLRKNREPNDEQSPLEVPLSLSRSILSPQHRRILPADVQSSLTHCEPSAEHPSRPSTASLTRARPHQLAIPSLTPPSPAFKRLCRHYCTLSSSRSTASHSLTSSLQSSSLACLPHSHFCPLFPSPTTATIVRSFPEPCLLPTHSVHRHPSSSLPSHRFSLVAHFDVSSTDSLISQLLP